MIISLAVECFRGPIGRAPGLQLALWLVWDGPDGPWRSTLLERREDGALAAREGAVAKQVVDGLHERLQAAGLGARPVRVSEVVDTSDRAGHVRIRALFARAPNDWSEVVVPMLSSGFGGPDAEPLRDFLRALLQATGVEGADVRWAVLGEMP